jgi:hypothetical protein
MSFSFALDQLRFAIAARRTAILDHAEGLSEAAGAAPAPGPGVETKAAAGLAIAPADPAGEANIAAE